jgi:hypothetical protein
MMISVILSKGYGAWNSYSHIAEYRKEPIKSWVGISGEMSEIVDQNV